jgi:serine/threonine protein kinase
MKLFDFGLSRVLQKKDKLKDGTYKLTGRTGSLCYMAPEVARGKPYNLTADVFSFATLTWQVLELRTPFEGFTPRDYMTQVCERGFRPSIPSKWQVPLRELIKDSWKADLAERPDFTRVSNVLRGEMRDIADAGRASIHQRTTHMMNRSSRSHRNLMRSTIPKETEDPVPGISLSSSEEGGGDRQEED